LADSPTHKLIPENVTQLHAKSKKAIFDGIMDKVIAEIYKCTFHMNLGY
jgi:lysine/ornithine N-monooxygenase